MIAPLVAISALLAIYLVTIRVQIRTLRHDLARAREEDLVDAETGLASASATWLELEIARAHASRLGARFCEFEARVDHDPDEFGRKLARRLPAGAVGGRTDYQTFVVAGSNLEPSQLPEPAVWVETGGPEASA